MTRKYMIMAMTAMRVIGFLSANSVGAGTAPTIEKVVVSPASCDVRSGSDVTVTIKAKAAHPDDVLAYKLWTQNGTFTEWFPLSSAS